MCILFIALFYLGNVGASHRWTRNKPLERGVIHWDIISYYAYLPAAFIYGDVTLDFLDNPPEGFVNDDKFWFYEMETGKRLIVTSMGMSVLYAPGFFMAHALAPVFGKERDGYSSIYQLFLVLISLFYVIIAFVILKNLLLRYFNTRTTIWTLLAIALGTNIFFYATHEAPMAHASSFFLIILFLWMVDRWYKRQTLLNTLLTGVLLGFIALVRPSNILVLFILLLYGVKSGEDFTQRILFFLKKFHLVLIMIAGFILAWMPQFMYWHAVTGQFLFYSYGPHGGEFFWAHPHILETLFSFKKGWFVYAPLMGFAMVGLVMTKKRLSALFWPMVVLMISMIYVQSSWWCWWFGGSFGMRAFAELSGILAFPLAAVFEFILENRKRYLRYGLMSLVVFFVFLQQIQTHQYKKGFIHYNGMNNQVYWKSFMRLDWHPDYWTSLTLPDYDLARKGIYQFYSTGDKHEDLKEMGEEEGRGVLVAKITNDRKLLAEVSRYAKRSGIQLDEAVLEVAAIMYRNMTNL
ncbi:MAG: hypothetical protein GY790_07640 [Bacteroidetes bacterium]|nr:hypothetical protein [Bacteroidota bacterium]